MTEGTFPTPGEIGEAVDLLESLQSLPPSAWAEIHHHNFVRAVGTVLPVLRARRDRAQNQLREGSSSPSSNGGPPLSELEDVFEQLSTLADMVKDTRQDVGDVQDQIDAQDRDLDDVVERLGELEAEE